MHFIKGGPCRANISSARKFVPIAFVDGDHFSGVAGDAAVGEEIRRVGEDEVDGGFGDFFQNFETVAVVEADVVFYIVKDGGWERVGESFGHVQKEKADSSLRHGGLGMTNQKQKAHNQEWLCHGNGSDR